MNFICMHINYFYIVTLIIFILFRHVHAIEDISLEEFDDGKHDIVGEGTFGVCKKKVYRGHIVAVKYFKDNSLPSDVEKEALMISEFDHPGILINFLSLHQFHNCGYISKIQYFASIEVVNLLT